MQRSVLVVFVVLWVGCGAVFGQHELEMKDGYYVVVAAYAGSKQDYADRFSVRLKEKGYDAAYGYNTARRLFFVYLKYFESFDPSIKDMLKTREKGLFTDAWVRIVKDAPIPIVKTEVTPRTEQPVKQEVAANNARPDNKKVDTTANESGLKLVVEKKPKADSVRVKKASGPKLTPVVLNLVHAAINRPVDGEVQIIDTDRSRLIEKIGGNKNMELPDPKSGSGKLTLICDVFGYRKLQHDLNSFQPVADTSLNFVSLTDTAFVVQFDLVRYEKGDISTLYNVYFFNDAAVMRPESKYELNSLLQMMQENPKYRIRLHGHSNGQYSGKIYSVGADKDFFSLTNAHEGNGSAKTLSRLRAEVIKDWLVSKGIEKNRMEVKAWGGKRPLYDKNGVNAEKNVRVEVEVLQN